MASGIKLTYEYVKQFFKENGCELLDTKYENSHAKLQYVCSCGNKSEIRFSDFKNGKRCKQCMGNKIANKLKKSQEEVYEYFKINNCELLDIYKNSKIPVKYRCKCGNIAYISLSDFQVGKRCADCGGTKKLTYEFVSEYFRINNCFLLENDYINNRTKMKYQCSCGNVSYITFSHFQQGHRCKICKYQKIAEANRLTYNEVKKIFEEQNCELLSDTYINAHQKLEFKCSCGNITYITYRDFSRGSRCKSCMGEKISQSLKLSHQQVSNQFKEFGYELLENEYVNAHQKLRFKCDRGHIGEMEYASFQQGCRCYQCSVEDRSGENHYLWNPNLTEEEREYARKIPGYNEWRVLVFKRDNYTCQICGQHGGNLRAHHLDGYHWCVEGRTEIINGVTLCESCHDINKEGSFHSVYGSWNNTKEQFEEFKANKLLLKCS